MAHDSGLQPRTQDDKPTDTTAKTSVATDPSILALQDVTGAGVSSDRPIPVALLEAAGFGQGDPTTCKSLRSSGKPSFLIALLPS